MPSIYGSLMLVDDDQISRYRLASLLRGKGYHVVLAEDGRQALTCLEKERFDLVLLDLMMSVMDGFELLGVLRQQYTLAELPIIILTGKTQNEMILKALNLGANDYLSKSEDLSIVLARIQIQLSLTQNERLLSTVSRAQNHFISHIDQHVLFDELLSDLLSLTHSEYGFIGEVFYTAEQAPYLKTYAISNIAWNEETQALYADHAPEGMEFHNLDTLFGTVMKTGEPVIANQPITDPRRGGLPQKLS